MYTPPDAFYGNCVRAEASKVFNRPTTNGKFVLNCNEHIVENGSGSDPALTVWVENTSEPSCKGDNVGNCKRNGDLEVDCKVTIAEEGTDCKDTKVTAYLHAICCYQA